MEKKANGLDGKLPGRVINGPTNPMVTPLLNDLYQFTMAYAYWKAGKQSERSVFDLYFRKNPFGGEYTIFAGLEECIKFLANFNLTNEEIDFVRDSLPGCEEAFCDYLRGLDCSDIEVYAISEGSVVFPKVPLLRIEGPVAVVQLLETPFLNLINYASLVATNAARHRFVAGKSKLLLEFGARRAQGPDGAISASKYCYLGGFDATSNVAAGKLFGIPLRGTHSHAFVSSFMSLDEIDDKVLRSSDGKSTCEDFVTLVQTCLTKIQNSSSLQGIFSETNQSELAAFISYALAFPNNFLALVDTYDVMKSGTPNFCAVALALNEMGYKAVGIRLDSGDLAYLSTEVRKFFCAIERELKVPDFGKMIITASNDLNEETVDALNKQGHEVDAFGIGTNLVTCYSQAALGCVFKLVEINNQPRIKLSEDVTKDRSTGRSRGFGYVTFASAEDAKNALKGEHFLGNRILEVKVATPKEEMRQPAKKVTRIFVARIPSSVSESDFRSHFETYGEITDLYMPKDHNSKQHRGIGFITFSSADSVEDLMEDTHDLGGTTVAVDRATPKEDDHPPRPPPVARMSRPPVAMAGGFGAPGGYGAYDAYISAATRYAALGAPTLYDNPATFYGRGGEPTRGMGNKIFVGRLPQEASVDDLRDYFGRFGRIQDAYIPKDPKRSGHRGFGFVTFAENGVADRVARRSHEICGQEVAIDSATPLDEAGPSAGGSSMLSSSRPEYFGGYGGPMRTFGRMYGGMSLDDWGYGMPNARPSRSDWRYRPY